MQGNVGHRRRSAQTEKSKKTLGLRPRPPRGKELKIQAVSILETRKPRTLSRSSGSTPPRIAERAASGTTTQEPPRTTRPADFPCSQGTVGRRVVVGLVPAILDPLPNIAVGVVELEGIRRDRPRRRWSCGRSGHSSRSPARSHRPTNSGSSFQPGKHTPTRLRRAVDRADAVARRAIRRRPWRHPRTR